MRFEYPYLLFLTIVAAVLILFIKKREINSFFNPKIVIKNQKNFGYFLPIAMIFVIISLARPVYEIKREVLKNVVPLFIAIDFSNSMRCKDIKPNRLIEAKRVAKDLIKKGDSKVSLIIFTTNPLIISPPTEDKKALLTSIDSIKEDNILTKSTSFFNLLKFISQFDGRKNLVIISDGGDFKKIDDLADIAKKDNIEIFGIGVATKEGALIPQDNSYLKDKDDKLVVSRLNENFISFTKSFGGYFENNYLDILKKIKKEIEKSRKKEKIELFFIPLIIAFLIFVFVYTTIFEKIFIKIYR